MQTIVEQKQELNRLIDKLVDLGENADELNLWVSLFDTMSESQQKKLLDNLSEEFKALEKQKV